MTIDLPDFRNMTACEAIDFLKAQKDVSLEPLIRWIAEAEASRWSNHAVRLAIADGERYAEGLTHESIKR